MKLKNKQNKTEIYSKTISEPQSINLSEINHYQEMFSHTLTLGDSVQNRQNRVTKSLIKTIMPTTRVGTILITPHTSFAKEIYEYALLEKEKGNINKEKEIYFIDFAKQKDIYINLFNGTVENSINNINIISNIIRPLKGRDNAFIINVNEYALNHSIAIMQQIKGNNTTIEDLYKLLTDYNYASVIMKKLNEQSIENTSYLFEHAVYWLQYDYWIDGQPNPQYQEYTSIIADLEYIIQDEVLSSLFDVTGVDRKNKTELNFKDYVFNKSILTMSTDVISNEVTSNILMYIILEQLTHYYVFVQPIERAESMLFIEDCFNLFVNKHFDILFQQGTCYKLSINLSVSELNMKDEELRSLLLCTRNKFFMKDMNQNIINYICSQPYMYINHFHIENNNLMWKYNNAERLNDYFNTQVFKQKYINAANKDTDFFKTIDQARIASIKKMLEDGVSDDNFKKLEVDFPGLMKIIEEEKNNKGLIENKTFINKMKYLVKSINPLK